MQRGNNNSHNGTGGVHQACASCKHQRKKCGEDCILAPYFPADKSHEFQAVHKVFGVSNVMKLVRSVNKENRKMVVDSLVWEACCRQNDPILGPLGEFKRIEEELKLYKSQSQSQSQMVNQNQLLQQGSLMYKPPPVVIPWNGMNNKGNGIGGGLANNNMVNYSHENGHSIPCSYPVHYGQSLEKIKHEKEVGSLIAPLQQQHPVGGFNHQPYFPGEQQNIKNAYDFFSNVLLHVDI